MYKTIREEAAIVIRNKILRGELKQGERIKEADIARELGVSRGPIREALRQLEQEGLVVYSSRRGCTVNKLSASDISELYLLRASLENLAVKLCDGKYQESTINELYKIVDEMEKYSEVEDIINIVECDQRFHEFIVKEAHMKKLYEMWATLNSANAIIFFTLYHSRYSPKEMLAHNHRILVDALKEGNCIKICQILQEHYLIVSKNLYKDENIEMDYNITL